MVGDRKFDIDGARANGIAAIAVTYGYGERAELEAAGPTHFAATVPGVTGLIRISKRQEISVKAAAITG